MKVQTNKVVSFSQNINDELFSISKDLLYFSLDSFENVIVPNVEQFLDQFPLSDEERDYYFPYYFWWMVFCSRGTFPKNRTIYQMFLQENLWKYKKKPHLESILLKWQYVTPSFFYIKEMANKRIFCLVDIFDYHKYKAVVVPQDTFKKPASKDALAGIILPLADGGYFSVIDPLIIPDKITAPLISKVISFYKSNITITTEEFFSRHYPEMLKMTIEHLIEFNNK